MGLVDATTDGSDHDKHLACVIGKVPLPPPARKTGPAAAREQVRQPAAEKAYKRTLADGGSEARADAATQEAGDAALAGKDASQELDWVAGGNGALSGLGNSTTNRSIGSQWIHEAPGSSTTRAEDLRNAAEAAKKAGKKTMEVKLKRC